MPEKNLFEIQAVDEDNATVAEPTEWLRSLPAADQVKKLQHYLEDLQAEYEMVADAMERARVSRIMTAARHYLNEIQDSEL